MACSQGWWLRILLFRFVNSRHPKETSLGLPDLSRARVTRDFFQRPFLTVASEMIGTEFIWQGCGGRIVEVEAYAVDGDPACHTAHRPSSREFVRTRPPGTAYVYLNYGMYWLLNVLVLDGILLIRALEPKYGVEEMRQRRGREKLTELCSGPGKVGVALGLSGQAHGTDLTAPPGSCPLGFFLAPDPAETPATVIKDVRIGISQATERPWRFLLAGSPHISVPVPAPKAKIGTRASRRR